MQGRDKNAHSAFVEHSPNRTVQVTQSYQYAQTFGGKQSDSASASVYTR